MYKVDYFKRIIRHYFSITIEAAGVKDPDCLAEVEGALDGIGEVIEGQATVITQALDRINALEKDMLLVNGRVDCHRGKIAGIMPQADPPPVDQPETPRAWYASNAGNDYQGLVIDEKTGQNVAVTYRREDAALVAAAPDLLDALRCLLNRIEYQEHEDDQEVQIALAALDKATGSRVVSPGL